MSTHRAERLYLNHELSRCLLELGSTEKAYKPAVTAYRLAKEDSNSVWAFNIGFLISLIVLMEGAVDDAKIRFTEIKINARKLDRDDCAIFIKKVSDSVKLQNYIHLKQ